MNILLVGNYENTRQQSMQRFGDLLQASLTEAGHEVRLIKPEPWFGRLRPGELGLGKWLGYLDCLGLFVPRLVRALQGVDVVHICDHSNAHYIPYLGSTPNVVTCHDMIAIGGALEGRAGHRVRWSGRVYQHLALAGLRRAQLVACVSERTRAELIRLSGVDAERTRVVHNAQNYPYSPMPEDEARARLAALGVSGAGRFLLHVGGNQWYKNRRGVVRIFAELARLPQGQDLSLVLAGKAWSAELQREVEQSGVAERVTQLSALENEDLRALYSAAAGLLFPSLDEGFGWPIIEAQACGCPVFTSNRLPMTEVGGRAVTLFDPSDEVGAAKIVGLALSRRVDDASAGFENVKRFSRKKMLRGYLDAYEAVLADARR